MTSKEALQELFIRVGGYRDNEEYTTSRVREIIMKDLEVLEILKRGLYNTEITNGYLVGLLSAKVDEEEINKVKEWLENE